MNMMLAVGAPALAQSMLLDLSTYQFLKFLRVSNVESTYLLYSPPDRHADAEV